MAQEDSPLSPYLHHTDSSQDLDLQVHSLLAAEVPETGSVESRLKRAVEQVKALKDFIVSKLLPELEALRSENRASERSADLVRSVDHLERRFYQSESILKRTIEDLKQQLDSERLSKAQLQQELHYKPTSDQAPTLVNYLQTQLQDLQNSQQAEAAVLLQAQELRLKEQHAREMAQMYENYDLERQKVRGTATGEVKRLGEALGQIQGQNRFLLQLLEDKSQLISTLTAMLETERSKAQPNIQAHLELQQIRTLVSDLLYTKEGNLALEKRNSALSAKLAVGARQKTERKARETERFYSAEIGQLSKMLGGLKTEQE